MKQTSKGIHEAIEIVYRRKWIIAVPLILGVVTGALIAYTTPSYYKSSTLIMIEQQKVPESYVKSTDETPIERRLNTISQQIMSRTKLEQIITEFNLYRDEPSGIFSSKMANWFGFARKGGKEELVEKMRKDIEVRVLGEGAGSRRGGDAFSISFTGREPSVTMQVTNTLASFFIEENLKIREQYAEGTSEFLADELEKAKQELESQETALKSFKERNMGSLPQQMEANLRTLDRLQMELQATHAALKNAEDKKNILEEQISTLSEAVPHTTLHQLEAELVRLNGELSSLLSTYKENYPDVVLTKNKIKEVEKQLTQAREKEAQPQPKVEAVNSNAGKELIANRAAVNSHIEALGMQEANIRQKIRIYQKRVEDIPASEQMLANIQRDYDTSQANYQALLEKRLNARLAENMEKRQKGERFRIIDPANLPEKPYKPDRMKITLGGSAVGLGIGGALVYLFEFLNPAFRRPEDFRGVIDKPVLAVIPVFGGSKNENPKKLRFLNGAKEDNVRRQFF